jgi:hypothetical protein
VVDKEDVRQQALIRVRDSHSWITVTVDQEGRIEVTTHWESQATRSAVRALTAVIQELLNQEDMQIAQQAEALRRQAKHN